MRRRRIEPGQGQELVWDYPGGDFYGGWIPPDIIGPFKGAPGTWGW